MAQSKSSYAPLVSGVYSFTPSAVPAFSWQTETFTVKGIEPQMIVRVQPHGATNPLAAGLNITGSTCTAANVLALSFFNATNATITPSATNFLVSTL